MDESLVAAFERIASEFNLRKPSPYLRPVYVLESTQTVSDVPADFPAGGLIFQKQ
jgi:hypothetical protein